jgi:hypothetical protein
LAIPGQALLGAPQVVGAPRAVGNNIWEVDIKQGRSFTTIKVHAKTYDEAYAKANSTLPRNRIRSARRSVYNPR